MCEKILLIDGHSILNRAYHGLPDLTNSEELHTNAVYGFLNNINVMFECGPHISRRSNIHLPGISTTHGTFFLFKYGTVSYTHLTLPTT